MSIPHLKFVKTLIAHKDDLNTINRELEKSLMPPLGTQAFSTLRNEMYKTYAEYFDDHNPKTEPPESLLLDHDISELYAYRYKYGLSNVLSAQMVREAMPGAIQILDDPLMRRAMQALSISGNVPEEDIELIINGKYDITYISENFAMFIKYFFDIKSWTLAQKRDYVKTLHPSQKIFREAYAIALKGDKNYLLWKLGLAPDKSFDQMLRDMMVDCFYNFREQTGSNADAALKWGTLMAKISDRLDKMDKDDDNKVSLYQNLTFELKQDESFANIVDIKDREDRGIELPILDTGDSADITDLEKIDGEIPSRK
jgi:hypothetical protein